MVTIERKVIKKGGFDVIVVGGGIAGIAASVAASRAGASVLLVEKGINLGGLATSGLISWYEPLCDGKGTQMVYGIAEELIKLSCQHGFDDLPTKWGGDGKNKAKNERYSTHFSPTVFSLLLDRYVEDNGVKIRFDSLMTVPVMENGICKGVVVESVEGAELFEASAVIDATGDASLMHRAGVPTVDGRNYFSYVAHMFTLEDVDKLIETGNLCKFRRWVNAGSDLYGNGHPEGAPRPSGTTADEVTDFVINGKKRMLDRISAFEKNTFDIMTLPTMPQFRTIRRIIGNTDFCAIDGETFEDSIGNCGDFRPKGIGNHYQIPFGSLWNKDFPNMLAAGRIISAPEGDGWEASRVIPICALTGEAAGKAAALCVKENKLLTDIALGDIEKIKIN